MLELIITAARSTRKLLNEEPCHSGGLLPGSFCRYKSWNFVMFWLIGNRVIIALKLYMKVTCSIVTWSVHKLASHGLAPTPNPGFKKQRESKYVYFFVSLCYLVRAVLHAATQCYLLFVSGERIWQVQYTMFIWRDKFFIPILSRKWNYLSTEWATSFLDRLIMRERIAELYFLARSCKVESIF